MEFIFALIGEKPEWLTADYFEDCVRNRKLQDEWIPEAGDHFVCRNTGTVHRIVNVAAYAAGDCPLVHIVLMAPENGRRPCDIYVPQPPPERSKMRLRTNHTHTPRRNRD